MSHILIRVFHNASSHTLDIRGMRTEAVQRMLSNWKTVPNVSIGTLNTPSVTFVDVLKESNLQDILIREYVKGNDFTQDIVIPVNKVLKNEVSHVGRKLILRDNVEKWSKLNPKDLGYFLNQIKLNSDPTAFSYVRNTSRR